MSQTLEKDFEIFFNSLKKQGFSLNDINSICKPLKDYYRLEKLKKFALICLCLTLLYAMIVFCDGFSWFLSAVTRLILIQFLPYWNWPELYNAKCLIDRSLEVKKTDVVVSRLGRYETEKENCLLCEIIDYIPSLANTSFAFLESSYLERSYPVIVTDSHQPMSPTDIYHLIFNKSFDFLRSTPCDVATNLMLNKFFDIEIALKKAWNLNHSTDKWFLQLRNCQFKAVKSARNFIKRPYYYPVHLEPYYSSWILMSHNYRNNQQQQIYLQGLIIVQQLWGDLDLSLQAKEPCLKCPVINVHLREGESLIFSTDLWIFSYSFVNDPSESIATIMEIVWYN
ncbi:uncharacterized protein LOC111675475 [Lucilia cuprina]|uniref:uncharacterized protein LOC111675475 n=1 Tax=Lucilia cuprina TaxID=7375 RepID=UPI001F058A37|nr:uncharacterized protein LOC111675475 [Lucilia cuprina]